MELKNDLIRSFICITFPDSVIKEIAKIQDSVEKYNFSGKITELENIHLTLKFLGELTPELLENIKEKLKSIVFPVFNAKLFSIGTFNIRGKPKIVWIKITSKEIFELQKLIDHTLKDLLPIEARFMSHLTIARINFISSPSKFKKFIENIKFKPLEFEVKDFKLNSSQLLPLGPVYHTLNVYPLK